MEKAGKYAVAIMALVAVVGLPFKFFQTVQAAEQAKQEVAKSINELRIDNLMARINELNEKEEKAKLTPKEVTERDLAIAQVKSIQAEEAKRSK